MPAKKQARSLVSVLKKLYQTMLVDFGIESTMGALKCAARDLPLMVFVAKVWEGKGYLPTEHTYSLLNELEKTCIRVGKPFEPFFTKTLLDDHHGSFLNSTEAFSLTNQILWKLFHVNLLQCIFEHLENLNAYLNPGNHHLPIKFTTRKDKCLMVTYFDINLDVYLSGHIVGIMLSSIPHWFNYEMDTHYCLYAERRSIQEQLDFYKSCGLLIEIEQDQIPVKTMDFKSFCEKNDIPYPKKQLAGRNFMVEIPQADILDKSNGYVILRKDVAYNAPGILCEVSYPCKPSSKEFNLKKAEQKISHEAGLFFRNAKSAHETLMSIVKSDICIEYSPKQGKLFYNGVLIAKGKPGHIIAVMIKGWCDEKITDFKNADFYNNPAIRFDKYDKSFNICIKRVLKIVQNKMPLFSIERKTGSAAIFFTCKVAVKFCTVNTH